MTTTYHGITHRISPSCYDDQMTMPPTQEWLDNIYHAYKQASNVDIDNAIEWYPNATIQCHSIAQSTGYGTDVTCAIVSAISPQTRWIDNLKMTHAVLSDGVASRVNMPTHSHARVDVVNKLLHEWSYFNYVDSSLLGILKTQSFYRLLTGDMTDVALDSHVVRMICGKTHSPRATEYFYLVRHVQQVAQWTGIEAGELQALLWILDRKGKVD